MKNKRLIAKACDVFLVFVFNLSILTMIVFFLMIFSIGVFGQVDPDAIAGNKVEIEALLNNTVLVSKIIFLSKFSLVVATFIYFGIIGALLKGSPGKYLLGLRIDIPNNNIFGLALREPLFQISVIALGLTSLLMLITKITDSAIIIEIFTRIAYNSAPLYWLYLILFILNRDIWNKSVNVSVVEFTQSSEK